MPLLARAITEADAAEMRRLRDKLDGARGPGVTNSPRALTIGPVAGPRGRGGSADADPLIRITAAVRDGANWRWTYTARRQRKAKAAWEAGAWEDAGESDLTAYNLVERDNGPSGVVSGIVLDADVTGVAPAPIGSIVVARPLVSGGDEPKVEYWFTLPNAPIIAC